MSGTREAVIGCCLALVGVACGADGGGGRVDANTPPADGGTIPAPVQCGDPTGQVFYVSPAGDDANPGTDLEPLPIRGRLIGVRNRWMVTEQAVGVLVSCCTSGAGGTWPTAQAGMPPLKS